MEATAGNEAPLGPGDPALRRALQAVVAQSLRTVTLWMGGLFLLFAPLDAWVSTQGATLALLDLALGVVFLCVHALVRLGLLRDGAAHAGMGLVALAVLPYLAANLLVTADPVQSAGWALWQMSVSLLVLSWPWLLALLAASNLLWALLVLRLPPSPEWAQFVFVLATATVIAMVAHGVRLRTFRRLEGMRLVERQRRDELDRARAATRELEAARQVDAERARFINLAAHELSTPMTPIVLQLSSLRQRGVENLTERQRKSLDVLGRNVARLQALVRDVLESARLQAGRLPIVKAPCELAPLLAEVLADYATAAEAGGVAVRLDCPAGLEAAADARRVAQVVGNLLGNALKFTPEGGSVAVAARRGAGGVEVEVTDTGAGVAPEDLPRLFEPFAQAHDSRVTGLGLYIAKGIVEQHGGAIGCESAGRGRGARFWFTLPG